MRSTPPPSIRPPSKMRSSRFVVICCVWRRVSAMMRQSAPHSRAGSIRCAITAASTSKAQVEALEQSGHGPPRRRLPASSPEFTLLVDQGSEPGRKPTPQAGTAICFTMPTRSIAHRPCRRFSGGRLASTASLVCATSGTIGNAIVHALRSISAAPNPKSVPIQLPYRDDDRWLARLNIPNDPNFVVDSERLLYTAHYPQGFSKASAQCGTPLGMNGRRSLAAGARNYRLNLPFTDRPSTEPPQVILLVTPPAAADFGSWQWDDF